MKNDIYPRAAGECFQNVKHLRKSVQDLLTLVDSEAPEAEWIVRMAEINLDISQFADKEFAEVYGQES